MSVRTLRYSTMNQHITKSALASTDRDALAFLEAATIYNTNQQRAIIQLVRGLKRTGLWSKMKAIYPFIGGTATTHKWNLKDPRDTDAAFRLTFSGGWTHSTNGALPNGTNAYADSYVVPTSNLTENTTHLSYYSRTNSYVVSRDIGMWSPTTALFSLACGSLSDGVDKNYGGEMYSPANWINVQPINDSTGYYIITRTSSTYLACYRNNTLTQSSLGNNPRTTTASGWSACSYKLWLGALNRENTAVNFGNKQAAFATIGDGLSATEIASLHNIVDLYQKRLGRAV